MICRDQSEIADQLQTPAHTATKHKHNSVIRAIVIMIKINTAQFIAFGLLAAVHLTM